MADPSLNPALEAARYCPRCGAGGLDVDFPRSMRCGACGYIVFSNPKPVACAIPWDEDGHVILLRRGFEPGKGLWTFPGGFVDLGETVEDAARREAMEELEIEVELQGLVGVYSRADERVVLVVFEATTKSEPRTTPEATEVRAFAPHELPWDELAFWSTERALRELVDRGERGGRGSRARPGSG
ncbi:MAG: NUDIX domain-containing protein [Solirubrobacterales bacterium]|nr:NUDIX domain-containing protein [Solirubrobacterales bacterium]